MVTVIIPNYNHAEFLKQRIDSVLNQSYQDFELIILDDCSKDKSRLIIEGYRNHPKVSHIILNDENSGSTFRQWAKGLEIAKGDWIWIAESDDYCSLDFLEQVTKHINSETGLIFANSYSVDEHNNILAKGLEKANWLSKHIDKNDFLSDFLLKGEEELRAHLLYNNTIYNASAVIFRKNLIIPYIKEANGWKLYGDWLLWVRIAVQTKVKYIADPLNYFRCHTNNVRTKTRTRIKEMIAEHRQFRLILASIIRDLPLPEAAKKELLNINNQELKKGFKALSLEFAKYKSPFQTIRAILYEHPTALTDLRHLRHLGAIYYHKIRGSNH